MGSLRREIIGREDKKGRKEGKGEREGEKGE